MSKTCFLFQSYLDFGGVLSGGSFGVFQNKWRASVVVMGEEQNDILCGFVHNKYESVNCRTIFPLFVLR
jgi:hypothetical protein